MRELLAALPRAGRWHLLKVIPLTGIGLVATGFLLPLFIQVFTDRYLIAGRDDWLRALLAGMALTALARAGLTWLQRRTLLDTQQIAARELNETASTALLAAASDKLAQLDAATPGHILRRQHRALALLFGEVAQGLTELPAAPFLLAVMAWFDPLLAGLALLLATMNAVVYVAVARRRVQLGDALAKAGGEVAAMVERDLGLFAAIKAGATEAAVKRRWLAACNTQAAKARELALAGQKLAVVPHVLAGLSVATLLAVGAVRVIDGIISVGDLVACQTLLFSINDALTRFIEASRLYPDVAADLRRRRMLLDLAQNSVAKSTAGEAQLPAGRGELRIEGLVFSGLPVHLTLPPGGQLAIVADAREEIHPLCRVFAGDDPAQAGAVRVDGVALSALSAAARARAVALVDGNAVALDDTLRENIRLWDECISDAAIAGALQLAGFPEALDLRDRLDTHLGRRELSGGQLRRVMLAQALVRRPRVLILDGALEALDVALARLILRQLAQAGISTVLVSARGEVLAQCTYLLVNLHGHWRAQLRPQAPS